MLRDLPLKAVYRSESDNLLEDFYLPALRVSCRYDRAVGFFSGSMISCAAQGLSAFIALGGRMRLIFGGEIEADEADSIRSGYNERRIRERLGVEFSNVIENLTDALVYRRLETLAWMVAQGTLDVKVAVKQKGMYHEKIGMLMDETGSQIVFEGSANETVSAMLPDFNFESLNVFPTWRKELYSYFQPYLDGFEQLWANKSQKAVVLEFPDAARQKLIQIAKTCRLPKDEIELDLWRRLQDERDSHHEIAQFQRPIVPVTVNGRAFELMDHQREALNAWRSEGWRGIFAMCTGSGKTITALYGAVKLYDAMKRMFLVIAVPFQSLADQWVRELKAFSITAIPCYGGKLEWWEALRQYIFLYQTKAIPFVCVVVVNRTLDSPHMQEQLRQVPGDHLVFIGDECHYHRAQKIRSSLPLQAQLRLGLSATPEDYGALIQGDPLVSYYGPVVARYDIARALREKVLTPYKYYVHLIDLTPTETESYEDLSGEIARLAASAGKREIGDVTGDDRLDMLLYKRARLLGAAANKIPALKTLLSGSKPDPLTLFYCGDGTVENEETGESMRQVHAVSTVLYEHGWRSALFTAGESRRERLRILDNFRLGQIDAMVAIRCLDEGIDIPACRTAYILASSRNPRQFVQRRGRILRRSPGKELAIIHDFVVTIAPSLSERFETERQLFVGELRRITEFSRSSMNPGESYRVLERLLKRFDLIHEYS